MKVEPLPSPIMDEAHEKEMPVTWHDVGLSIAAELMGKMRAEVHAKLGYLTSAVSCLPVLRHSDNMILTDIIAGHRKE